MFEIQADVAIRSLFTVRLSNGFHLIMTWISSLFLFYYSLCISVMAEDKVGTIFAPNLSF